MAKKKPGMPEELRQYLAERTREQWRRVSKKKRSELASHAAKGYWDSLTPEQRQAEMKRRAAVRKKKRPARSNPELPRES